MIPLTPPSVKCYCLPGVNTENDDPQCTLHNITLRFKGIVISVFTESGTARAKTLNAIPFETMKFSPLHDAELSGNCRQNNKKTSFL